MSANPAALAAEHSPLARSKAWLAVGSMTVGTFAMVTSEILPVGLLPEIAADLRISEGAAGLMVTVPGVMAAVAAPVLALTAGRVDRRLVLWGLSFLILTSNLIVALAPTFTSMLVGRALLGVCVGGFWTFAVAAGRRLVSEADGNRATAMVVAGIAAGTVVGVPIGALLGHAAGWRAAFGAISGLAALVLLLQCLLLPRMPLQSAASVRGLIALLRVPRARLGFMATALVAAGHFAAYTYFKPLLQQDPAMTPARISMLLFVFGIAGFVGTFLGERAMAVSPRFGFLGTGLLVGIATLLLPHALGNSAAMIGLVAIWGAAFGAVPVCVQIWLYRSAPAQFESGSALTVTVFQSALGLGAFAGGALIDQLGVESAMYTGSILATLSAALLGLLGRREPLDRAS
jgi:predicted MFS family arabinose efflux permease